MLSTRTRVLGAVMVGTLALAGCSSSGGGTGGGGSGGSNSGSSGSSSGSNSGSSSGSAGKRLKMGIAVANISLNFAASMVDGAKEAAKHEGNVDFQAVGPPNTDGPAEQQLFTTLTTTATDGVVLENLDPPIFTRPAAQAVTKGVTVVALDTSPTPGSKVDFYVGNDNYQLGVQLADEALKNLGSDPSGEVLIGVPNPGTPVLDNRAKGISDTFKAKAPKVKIIGPFQTYSDPAQNFSAWQSQVNAHPNALAFLGVGDADSYDLAKIKKTNHGKYLVAGFDVDAKTLDYVKSGELFCTVDPEHFLKGYIVTSLLIKSKRGGKLPSGWFETPGQIVTKTNVDAVITRQKSADDAYNYYKPQIDSLTADVAAHMKPMSQAR
jgi:ABC-type sugar transport system substrate-binding protein